MDSILERRSHALQKKAWEIVEQTHLIETWQENGMEVHPVGSLAMDLMMTHRDIDVHIYSDPFRIADSFKAAGQLAAVPGIQNMTYFNFLEAEDRCLEWHAHYTAPNGETWKMDMIHIRKDSVFAGFFEKVAERVKAALTDETRHAILAIKAALPEEEPVMGIRIYRAVLEGGVRDLAGFRQWQQAHPLEGIERWMPE